MAKFRQKKSNPRIGCTNRHLTENPASPDVVHDHPNATENLGKNHGIEQGPDSALPQMGTAFSFAPTIAP